MSDIIEPSCAEELSQVVDPWQLTIRQLAAGGPGIRVRYTAVDDILLTNERWLTHLSGFGRTAEDYITVAGNNARFPVSWQGGVLMGNRLAVASANSSCEFHTPHGADHWVLLIPRGTFTRYLGIESEAEIFDGAGILVSEPRAAEQLAGLCNYILDGGARRALAAEPSALRDTLLSRVADLLPAGRSSNFAPRGRYATLRRALEVIDSASPLPTVVELARAVDVSQRVLELSFSQHLGVTPYRFLKLARLNTLHHTLLKSDARQWTVTELMKRHGFDELGRTAVEFRRLFSRHPSDLLRHTPPPRIDSFLDAIAPPPMASLTAS